MWSRFKAYFSCFTIKSCSICNCFLFFFFIAIKRCYHSSSTAVYYREKNDFATVIKEQFTGLTYSGSRESTWKASSQTAAANSQIDADGRKSNFPSEKVSGVNLLSLHSFVNYLGTFDSRTKTNGGFSNTTVEKTLNSENPSDRTWM